MPTPECGHKKELSDCMKTKTGFRIKMHNESEVFQGPGGGQVARLSVLHGKALCSLHPDTHMCSLGLVHPVRHTVLEYSA